MVFPRQRVNRAAGSGGKAAARLRRSSQGMLRELTL